MELQIETLMAELVAGGGSDLHLAAGQAPYGRFSGQLRPMRDALLEEEQCNQLIFSLLNNAQRKQLEQTWELDCSYGLRDVSRFRVNVYRQRGTYAAVCGPWAAAFPPWRAWACRRWWKPWAANRGACCW